MVKPSDERNMARSRWGLALVCMASLGALSLGACSEPEEQEAPRRPNILFILVDTLRADYLGTYGFQGDISPHVDKLAGESVLFENCLSQAPWTKPSMASIMTSTYPRVHKLTNHAGMFWSESEDNTVQTGVLSSEYTTLAESMKELGYRTAGFVANPWIAGEFGFAQGFDVYEDDETGRSLPGDIFMAEARDWLASLPEDDEQPVFLYVHLMDVHDPFHAPYTDARDLAGSPTLGGERQLTEAPPGYLQDNATSRSLQHWRAAYAANVRAFDRRFSFFLDGLRQTGLLDDSYLVFTSDHGEELAEHDKWAHGFTLHHHQVHVPLFIRRPGGEGGGRRVQGLVQSIDLLPTMVSLAGGTPPDHAQGRDLSSLLLESKAEGEDGLESSFASAARLTPGLYSMRSGAYSLIVDLYSGEQRLYDLERDPGEQWDLAAERPQVVSRLRAELDRHLAAMAAEGGIAPEQRPIDDERIEELQALGYTR